VQPATPLGNPAVVWNILRLPGCRDCMASPDITKSIVFTCGSSLGVGGRCSRRHLRDGNHGSDPTLWGCRLYCRCCCRANGDGACPGPERASWERSTTSRLLSHHRCCSIDCGRRHHAIWESIITQAATHIKTLPTRDQHEVRRDHV